MDYLSRLNQVMDYVEAHLDQPIDLETISKLLWSTPSLFLRMFSVLTGIPFSEYLRRRRLTQAAFELQSSETKVIDIALKYGYESADAFTVAFKRLHGQTPSTIRGQSVVLKSYPRLTFILSIRGDHEMNYRLIEKTAFPVQGRSIEVPPEKNLIPQFWTTCYQDGTVAKLCQVARSNGITGQTLLGICSNPQSDGTFRYLIGIESNADAAAGDLEILTIPASTWLVFESIGPMPHAIQGVWQRIYSEFMPNSIYKHAGTPDLEVYPDGDNSCLDYRCEIWIPVVKK